MNNTYEQQANIDSIPDIGENYENLNNVEAPQEKEKDNGLLSMIFGIISVITSVFVIGLPFGIAAIILALKDKAFHGKLRKFAIPGLITGIVGTGFSAIYLIEWLIVLVFVVIYIVYVIFLFVMIGIF